MTLLASPRHRPEDLSLWRTLEVADRVHGAASRLREKELVALHAIACFAAEGPCYAGVSGGKDSTVLAHLIHRSRLPIPLARVIIQPIYNPDCDQVIQSLLKDTGQIYYESRPWCRLDSAGWHATGTLEKGFGEIVRLLGTDRHISGVRANESATRKLRMRTWGLATERTLCPLGWWTAADVYGYLNYYRLPIHPAYAMLGAGRWPRDKIRVDHLGLRAAEQYGRTEWEREYYSDVLYQIQHGEVPEHARVPGEFP